MTHTVSDDVMHWISLQTSDHVGLGRVELPGLHGGQGVDGGRLLNQPFCGFRVLEDEPLLFHLFQGVVGVAIDGRVVLVDHDVGPADGGKVWW